MEFIIHVEQFEKMIDNKIIGKPKLVNTKLNFRGKNNILVCDNNVELNNVVLDFNGNNSIVYLGSDLSNDFKLLIYNNSTVYMGKDIKFGVSVNLKALESHNIIIGDNCVIGDNVNIVTSEGYSIHDTNSKKRINFSNSVYIGDHVFLGDYAYVSNGVNIGSGAIVSNMSFIPPGFKLHSNTISSGNPIKTLRENVFFTNDYLGPYSIKESYDSREYISDVFIFNFANGETLSPKELEKVLLKLDVESRLDFIQKLFVRNKRKNRFFI
jgi:acetyltransferase-like isoleucine patch superfamily enzyme